MLGTNFTLVNNTWLLFRLTVEASVLGTLNGGQSTQLVKPNYLVLSFLTSHRRRTIVSLETYPLCPFPLTSKTLIYVYLITLRNTGYEKTLI